MKVAIIGFDTEGRANYDYFAGQGHEVTICDQKTDVSVPEGVDTQLGEDYLQDLDRFDLIVRTAGLHPRKIIDANPGVSAKITSCTNEFLRVCPSRNIIGITGTKGKGTTSSLTAALLSGAGYRVHLGGNIGVPALELLNNTISPDDWVVLELSSFQLIDLKQSPHIAACLMVVPEHLDWHHDEAEYYAAKQQLFRWQTDEDIAVYLRGNETSTMIAGAGAARKVPYFETPGAYVIDGQVVIGDTAVCRTDELQLLGQHNWQNVCAAVTIVWQISQDTAALHDALVAFRGLEHRLEPVRELEGVTYFDDSFGTTPETAIVAIAAFNGPKVIILGGSDKGASYDELARTVAGGTVRRALLIGDQAARIQTALEEAGFHDFEPGGDTMTEIVDRARAAAQSGDTVLLSTGCASFDMFKNYKDRGDQFKAAVQSLA